MKKVSKLLIMSMSLFFASCGNNTPATTETDAPDCAAYGSLAEDILSFP